MASRAPRVDGYVSFGESKIIMKDELGANFNPFNPKYKDRKKKIGEFFYFFADEFTIIKTNYIPRKKKKSLDNGKLTILPEKLTEFGDAKIQVDELYITSRDLASDLGINPSYVSTIVTKYEKEYDIQFKKSGNTRKIPKTELENLKKYIRSKGYLKTRTVKTGQTIEPVIMKKRNQFRDYENRLLVLDEACKKIGCGIPYLRHLEEEGEITFSKKEGEDAIDWKTTKRVIDARSNPVETTLKYLDAEGVKFYRLEGVSKELGIPSQELLDLEKNGAIKIFSKSGRGGGSFIPEESYKTLKVVTSFLSKKYEKKDGDEKKQLTLAQMKDFFGEVKFELLQSMFSIDNEERDRLKKKIKILETKYDENDTLFMKFIGETYKYIKKTQGEADLEERMYQGDIFNVNSNSEIHVNDYLQFIAKSVGHRKFMEMEKGMRYMIGNEAGDEGCKRIAGLQNCLKILDNFGGIPSKDSKNMLITNVKRAADLGQSSIELYDELSQFSEIEIMGSVMDEDNIKENISFMVNNMRREYFSTMLRVFGKKFDKQRDK